MDSFKRKKHPWYDVTCTMGYDAVFNFIVGARGLGKTYGFQKFLINRNIKTGEQFIYLRRHKKEMQVSRATFFNAVAKEFPEWDFRVNGWVGEKAPVETRDDKKRQWTPVCYFQSLSVGQQVKGASFDLVTSIVFDEFIIEKGLIQYLPDEVTTLTNFYSTVDRNQDKTKVYFLANSVSITNPYFLEYDIRPDQLPELSTRMNGFMLIHFPDSAEFKASVSNTRFGRFIAGTEYEEYAVGNQFHDAHHHMIEGKPKDARPRFNLETKTGTFSVWYSSRRGEYFIQERLIGGDPTVFTMVPEKMKPGKILVSFSDKPMAYLRTAFRQGSVLFDAPKSRNAFVDIFSR